jgi:hypothetical protein
MSQKDKHNWNRIKRPPRNPRGSHCQDEKNDVEDISLHENDYFFFL